MAKRPYKRRKILIDRLQLRLLAITLSYFLLTAAAFALAMFAPLIWQLTTQEPGELQAGVAGEFLSLHTRFWPALVLTFVVLSVHSVFTTHRIVGPLYRFRVVFGQVKDGNLTSWVALRRRDLLMKEAGALNDMLTSLRDRVRNFADLHREAMLETAGIDRALQENSLREARVHLVELDRAMNRQREVLDALRVDPE